MKPEIQGNRPSNTYLEAQGVTDALAASTNGVNARTLAHLNFGIFRQLRSLGTSKERICSVLRLSPTDYDYIEQLG